MQVWATPSVALQRQGVVNSSWELASFRGLVLSIRMLSTSNHPSIKISSHVSRLPSPGPLSPPSAPQREKLHTPSGKQEKLQNLGTEPYLVETTSGPAYQRFLWFGLWGPSCPHASHPACCYINYCNKRFISQCQSQSHCTQHRHGVVPGSSSPIAQDILCSPQEWWWYMCCY